MDRAFSPKSKMERIFSPSSIQVTENETRENVHESKSFKKAQLIYQMQTGLELLLEVNQFHLVILRMLIIMQEAVVDLRNLLMTMKNTTWS